MRKVGFIDLNGPFIGRILAIRLIKAGKGILIRVQRQRCFSHEKITVCIKT